MKIFIIGATGMAGSAIVKEAVKNNLEVIANGRSADKLQELKSNLPSIEILAKDAFDLELNDFQNADVVVDAFATTPDQAILHVDLAEKLTDLFKDSSTRLGFVLGAGSLLVGEDDHFALKDIEADPSTEPWRAIPKFQLQELELLKKVTNVDWFGISPGLNFVAGSKSDSILKGKDHLLFNESGESETTSETMAISMIEELLHPEHKNERFTVANG